MILLASGNVASFQECQHCRCGQDNSTVAALSGDAQLTVGTPEKLGPVIRIDREWERGGVFPINVLRVGDAWHLYYSATSCLKGPGIVGNDFQGQCDARHGWTGAVCLATSRNGVTWEKPELGIAEFEGKPTNAILVDSGADVIHKDTAP